MKLDGEKLLATLNLVKAEMIDSVKIALEGESESDSIIDHSSKCTINNVIQLIKSGDYTIEDKG